MMRDPPTYRVLPFQNFPFKFNPNGKSDQLVVHLIFAKSG